MKRGDEALNSLLQFFRSVKCFIATIFTQQSAFNASLLLLFHRDSPLNASSALLSKVTGIVSFMIAISLWLFEIQKFLGNWLCVWE